MSDGPRHTSAILFSQLSRYFGTLFQLYNALLLLRPVLSVKRNPPRRWLYPAINKRKQQLCKNNEISRSPPRLYCFDFIPHVARLPTWTRVIYSHRSECSRWRPAGSWNFEIWYPIFLFIVTGFVPRLWVMTLLRSSRLIRNLSNCEREAWKKFRLQRDSNPWPLRYRCSALPTELWSHNCWEQVNFSGSIMPLRVIQHYSDWVCTAVMSNDVMKIFAVDTQFKQLRKRSLKKIYNVSLIQHYITIMLYYP